MHATVLRYEGVECSVDELLPAGRRLAAALGKLPGFVNHVVLDAGDGVFVTMSIFDSCADLAAAEQLIAEHINGGLNGNWPNPRRLSGGEVIIQRGL